MRIYKKIPIEFRFLRARFKEKDNGCVEWTGKKNHGGYGMIRNGKNGNDTRVHRISYSIFYGTIPKDKVIDHICRNRLCVNPTHLRIVSRRINNIENSNSPAAINSRKSHCLRGHPFIKKNIYIYKNKEKRTHRICKICTLNNQKIRRQKTK